MVASGSSDIFGPGSKLTSLDSARERWRQAGLHDYSFTFQAICFCAYTQPLRVLVMSDSVYAVTDPQTNQPVPRGVAKTVDGLFDFVDRAIHDKAHQIEATYDGGRGYPTRIDYDGSQNVADDELTYLISNLLPSGFASERATESRLPLRRDVGRPRP
jgi:hypothetical protein